MDGLLGVDDLGTDLALLRKYGYVGEYPGGVVIYVPDLTLTEVFDVKPNIMKGDN